MIRCKSNAETPQLFVYLYEGGDGERRILVSSIRLVRSEWRLDGRGNGIRKGKANSHAGVQWTPPGEGD